MERGDRDLSGTEKEAEREKERSAERGKQEDRASSDSLSN